jgi:hypothetical protein
VALFDHSGPHQAYLYAHDASLEPVRYHFGVLDLVFDKPVTPLLGELSHTFRQDPPAANWFLAFIFTLGTLSPWLFVAYFVSFVNLVAQHVRKYQSSFCFH